MIQRHSMSEESVVKTRSAIFRSNADFNKPLRKPCSVAWDGN